MTSAGSAAARRGRASPISVPDDLPQLVAGRSHPPVTRPPRRRVRTDARPAARANVRVPARDEATGAPSALLWRPRLTRPARWLFRFVDPADFAATSREATIDQIDADADGQSGRRVPPARPHRRGARGLRHRRAAARAADARADRRRRRPGRSRRADRVPPTPDRLHALPPATAGAGSSRRRPRRRRRRSPRRSRRPTTSRRCRRSAARRRHDALDRRHVRAARQRAHRRPRRPSDRRRAGDAPPRDRRRPRRARSLRRRSRAARARRRTAPWPTVPSRSASAS